MHTVRALPAARAGRIIRGHPSKIYVRAATDQVAAVHSVLAATANPHTPYQVTVSQPSDALVARAQASSALTGLFLGLGAALTIGAVAGLLPAIRAARMPPTEALRTL